MKKVTYLVAAVLTSTLMFSCGQAEKEMEVSKENTVENTDNQKAEEETKEDRAPALNVDSLTTAIDSYRNEVEENIGEGVEISTENMRSKIQQKWSKIHFYVMGDDIVRIKTYPHENVSKRTEEFYLKEGNLVLSVIEDDGEGERGKEGEAIDKMYYYHNSEMIKEVNGEERAEYSIKQSDAEELLSEVKEYLDAYKKQAKM